MEKASAPARWWDWASIALLFVLLEIVASRLVATTWTPFLYLAQTSTYIAFVVGVALGYSRFSRRLSQWLQPVIPDPDAATTVDADDRSERIAGRTADQCGRALVLLNS